MGPLQGTEPFLHVSVIIGVTKMLAETAYSGADLSYPEYN